MADAQPIDRPVVASLKRAKLPPLVHPQALTAAAALCADFGGNREALNAAALAGALVQAHILQAHKAAAKAAAAAFAMQPKPVPQVPLMPMPPAPPEPALDLSEQAKQAMAAAQATNMIEAHKEREKERNRVGTDKVGSGQEIQLQSGGPAVPSMAKMSTQGMVAFAPPVLQHQHPMQPMLVIPPRVAADARQVPQMSREPREGAKPVRQPKAAPERQEEKIEERAEERKPAPPKEDSEPVRCHLHRKPQLGCKICRRVYYTSLDPNLEKKEDRSHGKLPGAGDDEIAARQRGIEAFEITNKQTFNFNAMLRDQILKNTYFKTLVNIDTFEGIVDELYQYAETAEVYGAGSTTVPSTLFCCLFRLFTLGLSEDELLQLLESRDWPYVRCCGFLYIRFGCAAEKLWDHLGEYCLDDQEFEPSKASQATITIGDYVEALLMDERYYYTALPRIPVGVKKKFEEQIAPLQQYRKRTAANKRLLHLFQEAGTPVEVWCASNGEWREGKILQLVETIPTRLAVRVRLNDGSDEVQHLGKVILRETVAAGPTSGATARRTRGQSRSRSRSPRGTARGHSPDWSKHRGKSQAEMLQELRARQRERAVCSTGKDYARKPIGFMSGLALKRDVGVASTRLREEETYAPRQVEHRKQVEEERKKDAEERKKDAVQDREQQLRLQQLYEKYGSANQSKQGKEGGPADEVEEAEVLRLG